VGGMWWIGATPMRGRAVGGVVVGEGASVGAGVGGGAPVATRGCVRDVWLTGGHPTQGRAVHSAVVGAGELLGAGIGWRGKGVVRDMLEARVR
jgi:hypothetical protein